jgi:hypothetical protein
VLRVVASTSSEEFVNKRRGSTFPAYYTLAFRH